MYFIIVPLSNTWIFTENSDQGHVDAKNTVDVIDIVKWPEPKSVGFIVRQPDFRITYL